MNTVRTQAEALSHFGKRGIEGWYPELASAGMLFIHSLPLAKEHTDSSIYAPLCWLVLWWVRDTSCVKEPPTRGGPALEKREESYLRSQSSDLIEEA